MGDAKNSVLSRAVESCARDPRDLSMGEAQLRQQLADRPKLRSQLHRAKLGVATTGKWRRGHLSGFANPLFDFQAPTAGRLFLDPTSGEPEFSSWQR
jgi:hypothetical protein